MDVLYRVGRAPENEELRFSLRSLENVEHGKVHIVGHKPEWVKGVDFIPGRKYSTKWRALIGDTYLACRELAGKTLLLMDDDFYFLTKAPIETLHRGLLERQAAGTVGSYERSLRGTVDYLRTQGIKHPLSYELHVPMVIEADAMAAALEPVLGMTVQARSIYGNLAKVGGREAPDVKLRGGDIPKNGNLASSNGYHGRLISYLRHTFPKASRYE